MNYYEVTDPYYALIQAKNQTEAVEQFLKNVSKDADKQEVLDSITKISKDSAWEKYRKGQSENREFIPETELKEDFELTQAQLLLVDGSLL